ncbi:uncharacterized protein PpBr36_05576 [Pyricularia pennisetigena]|uniref:uncharacterized protein n=1 Tax=Pyricularia pennisetigena TaxID=1578925 RepID=UPI00114EBDB6|nr:uncharacterized protein PpBr36_05576 [Pyricularia pennisetigena]TLS22795.1 hypothetical protein PpBr36_05576 [Pyricularia pennisetigena]
MAEDNSSVPVHADAGQAELLPTPPKSPRPAARQEVAWTNPKASGSSESRHEYLESLILPSREEFNRIASIQNDREYEITRMSCEHKRSATGSKSPTQRSTTPAANNPGRPVVEESTAGSRPTIIDDILLTRAATLIQRTYRGYRTRRQMSGLNIDADKRWAHALREARFREITKPRPRSWSLEADGGVGPANPQNVDASERSAAARRNWRKAAIVARRAGWDEDSPSASSSDESIVSLRSNMDEEERDAARRRREESRARMKKAAQTMGLQYFLEMVDQKHRYGSNLRAYHEEWKKSDTHENFFYWLDFGEGSNLDMEACPRDRLEREQVRYLSREERQYYLVKIDADGRLCWAKNGARIDTTEDWKDSIKGIVPRDDTTPAYSPTLGQAARDPGRSSTGSVSSGGSDSRASDSELEAARAAKYANPTLDEAKGIKKVSHVSAATIFNKMLRKSVRKNTWIFVADTSFRLYVGIKDSGAFQHSSFLQGGRISAAGLIKIKNGRLKSLSPLSGHYRPPAANFRAFVKSLKDMGVDMAHVSISKSYAVLVGLEVYVRTRQKSKRFVQKLVHGKDKIVAPDEVAKRREAEKDNSQSAAREREVLEREAMMRREDKTGVRMLRKLGVQPRLDRASDQEPESRDRVKGGDAMLQAGCDNKG